MPRLVDDFLAQAPAAVDFCRSNGISVIPGGCPLMYGPTSDIAHRCIRWVLERRGSIPTEL